MAILAANATKAMKIIKRPLFALAMGSMLITQTGCFGEFALTRKVYEFHDDITSNKFVKSLLFFLVGGFVYSATGFIDAVILNLIEFWSGSNPLSMNDGDHEMQLTTIDGVQYRIDVTKDTYTTTQLTGDDAGEVRVMKFDRTDRTWKYSDNEVCDRAVLTILDNDAMSVRMHTSNGPVSLNVSDMADASVLAAKFANCDLAMAK